ncbi:uncharacterized protein BX664DRAFT_385306 [Halteromyces radiatus]|uniref:uncharacterized protein n=1 Tax=Halteromyces radiatus TaxID=101107 RepID=UPI0022203019|nr:uncharacterized protein BX664DRAFT_385306 [Halteromyces radiatus]KAI8088688.1 hypothetical protein BX664DRAFT_385306 [Halteromyces radiatus]
MSGKGVVRSIKNYAKGFSDVQIKVREATSNDAWGPSGTLMNEIAQATYNQQDFVEVMDMVDRRLNDKGKNWRHVFKALLLLDYCIHVGSENVVLYAKENLYVVKTLKEFQHIDDSGKDVGSNVRQKAKDITSLLLDDARLKEERHKRTQMRDRMSAVGDYMNETILDGRHANGENMYERPGYLDEDGDLRKAIEESKRLAQEEAKKRNQGDEDLAKALQLSEQEAKEKEQKQRAKLERENEQNLFSIGNDTQGFQGFPQNQIFSSSANPYTQQQQQQQWPQNTGMTGYSFTDPITAQQPMFNQQSAFGNPYQQQQQQQQGFPQTLQAQMTGMPQSLQAQMTGMPQLQQQQPQYTGMAPFQTNQFMAQPQQTQFTGMPAFQTSSMTGTNPFGQQSQSPLQQPSIQPQQTGFSNATPNFGQSSTTSFGTPTSQSVNQQLTTSSPTISKPEDPRYAKLNSLLGNREDGMDTFGNTGNLRIPFGTGYASTLRPEIKQTGNTNGNNNNNNNNNDTSSSSSFSQSFGQQPSRNPFGTGNTSTAATTNNNNKSLLEMMAEQKIQQQNQQLQPQITGFQQPQVTGFNNGFQQQQPAFGQQQQSGPFF